MFTLVSSYCLGYRYVGTLHFTFLINSAAHKFGFKPYDSGITAVDSFWLSVIALGEGGHNFHHTFPQDYRTSEYSGIYNVTKHFIDLLAYIGWVSNRKVVSSETVERQKSRNRTKIMG
ncbi:hypothetical protein AB6A40_008239 [Gnathostoma spinigerum]|uniref:Uncharacterized protein n=1 Tax=Gnathostoma spinigerum TaxID=75299 RepID=A0ABD6ENH7_9BILA